MELKQAIENALNGDAILFVGSGASHGATNVNESNIPSTSELSNKIYPNCDDIQQAVDLFLYSDNNSYNDKRLDLIELLKQEFTCNKVTEEQKQISNIPWKRIYTTNYDNVVELSYYLNQKQITSALATDDIKKRVSKDNLLCIHINGFINDLNIESLNSSFKLSETSYNTDSFSNCPWGHLFSSDIKAYSTIIFLGFSMKYDLDIRRMINPISKKRIVFIVSEKETKNNIISLEKYGNVYPIGLSGFVEETKEVKTSFIPIAKKTIDNTFLTNFENRNNTISVYEKPSFKEVFNYYSLGKQSQNLYFPTKDSYAAIVKRTCINSIENDINSGIKAIFIHSDIGNGKSEIVDQLCKELSSSYSIYELVDSNEKLSDEIEMLCSSNKKTIVIIENFFNFYNAFQTFKLFDNNDNITYIFTARTSIYKSRFEAFEIDPIQVYDVNRLDKSEVSKLCDIFKEYGFYPGKTNNTERFITSKCHSRMQSVLLSMFEDGHISNSFEGIINEILTNKYPHYKLILFLIVSKIMSLNISFSDALILTNEISLNYEFENNNNVKELFDWYNGVPKIKSVALCVWLIKHKHLIKDVFDVLVDAAFIADNGYEANVCFERFLGNIISYKHLKFILQLLDLNKNDKRNIINDFYERIKNLQYYNNKYYFWLQYAISSIEIKDYSGAKLHFNASYATLPENLHPFEINNQYARLLMEEMLLDSYTFNELTVSQIKKIDKLLTPMDAKNDEKFYSYKMAAAYYTRLFNKFFISLNNNERDMFHNIAKAKYNACQKYSLNNSNDDFKNKISDFLKCFLYLSVYESENYVSFVVEKQKGKHLFGYFYNGKKKEKAHAFSNEKISNKKAPYNIKASVIEYSTEYGRWQLSLKGFE